MTGATGRAVMGLSKPTDSHYPVSLRATAQSVMLGRVIPRAVSVLPKSPLLLAEGNLPDEAGNSLHHLRSMKTRVR